MDMLILQQLTQPSSSLLIISAGICLNPSLGEIPVQGVLCFQINSADIIGFDGDNGGTQAGYTCSAKVGGTECASCTVCGENSIKFDCDALQQGLKLEECTDIGVVPTEVRGRKNDGFV